MLTHHCAGIEVGTMTRQVNIVERPENFKDKPTTIASAHALSPGRAKLLSETPDPLAGPATVGKSLLYDVLDHHYAVTH